VDGHLAAAFDEAGNCSLAVNYTTIQPLVQNLNDEDALPTAGELTIALVGDKSYSVQFDNAGILVDGELFTEENIDNSELAKECAEFMEDDDDDMLLSINQRYGLPCIGRSAFFTPLLRRSFYSYATTPNPRRGPMPPQQKSRAIRPVSLH